MNLRSKILGLCLLGAVSCYGLSAQAQDLPPGISMQVVQNFPAESVPGAKMVREFLFIVQPGAKMENFDMGSAFHFCTAMMGEIKVIMGGKTTIRRQGDRWIERPGEVFTIINEGDVAYVDHTFEIVFE